MKRITHIGLVLSAVVLGLAQQPATVRAASNTTTQVLIVEVSPASVESASEEYIKLYNASSRTLDVAGWKVQYRSAGYHPDETTGWSTRAIIGCETSKQADCVTPSPVNLKPGAILKLSSFEQGEDIEPLASGMASPGGVVRLLEPADQQIIHDKVGYGTAADFEGKAPAPAPADGRAIVRMSKDNAPVDTDENGTDFELGELPEAEQPEEPDGSVPQAPEEDSGPEVVPRSYLDVEISELLPDPASPQTDSEDEFVELYNAHDAPVDLTGYAIVTGASWSNKHVIENGEIPAQGYLALTAAQTNVSLSNAGTGVRLLDPDGKVLFETPNYGKADAGHVWTRDASGVWGWSVKPTPDAQNVFEAPAPPPPPKPKATSVPKKSTAKTTSTTKKPATPKTSTAKTAAATPPPAPDKSPETPKEEATQNVGLWVLLVAGLLGLAYAIYEYRQEIGRFIRRRWEALTGLWRK